MSLILCCNETDPCDGLSAGPVTITEPEPTTLAATLARTDTDGQPDGLTLICCEEHTLEPACTGGTPGYTSTVQRNDGTGWTVVATGPYTFTPGFDEDGVQYRTVCTDATGATASSVGPYTVVALNPSINPWCADEDYLATNCDASFDDLNAQGDPVYGAATLPSVSEPANNPDNGPGGNAGTQGQFRFRAYPSHFLKDDPILFPGQPGGSHLHMFWGNTAADAFSVVGDGSVNDLCECGASTVQGGAGANRTAYWMPALVDGPLGIGRNILVPSRMRMYYKSRQVGDVQPIPKGLQLLGGNVYENGPMGMVHGVTIQHPNGGGNGSRSIESAMWGFFGTAQFPPSANGIIQQTQDQIPPTNPNGYPFVRCVIGFPFAIQTDDGTAAGNPILSSPDFKSHATDNLKIGGGEGDELPTPASHPYRIPHLQYLIDWPCPTDPAAYAAWVAPLRLSSDMGADTDAVLADQFRGGSLHGDVYFAWNPEVQQAWLDGCYTSALGPRNCTNGALGQSFTNPPRALTAVPGAGDCGIILNDQTIGVTPLTIPDPYDV